MAIKVKCECGKNFGAPEKYAGKQVKCPGCGDPVKIPEGPAAASSAPAIKATCSCGKAVAVKPELAGRRIKCPGCGEPLAVPAAGGSQAGATRAYQPSPAASAPAGGLADLLDEADLSATNTGQRCPECRSDMGEDDILCIQCGYRVDRGRKIETKRVVKPSGMSMSAGPSQGANVSKPVQDLHSALRTLGFLNLACGILALVAWVAIFATGAVAVDMPPEIAGLLAVAFLIGGLISAVSIWLMFFAAKSVLEGKSVGRILSIVIAILYVPSVPIGTLIGVYLLVKSLSADVAAHCTR